MTDFELILRASSSTVSHADEATCTARPTSRVAIAATTRFPE